MTELLEFKNVTKVFSSGLLTKTSTTAVRNVSFKLAQDDPTIMTVAGESGSGKTTLAMLLLGFIPATSGQILYKGTDIKNLRGAERMIFRREVQAVFQDPFAVFNPFYTVDHLLTVPIKRFKLANSKSEAHEKMIEALTAVGLHPQDILGRFPHQLSGGQRQRINVARALVLRPKVLVADEPVSMVDASLRANILELLQSLKEDHGVSIIYITHDLTTAYHVAKSIMVMYRGTVMEAGSVDRIIKKPEHPYTRLLIDSIPWPDLKRRWGETDIKAREAAIEDISEGCKFYGRCPFAMDKCKVFPPLFQLNEEQAASCYLFDENKQIASEKLSELLPV
ncbi:MAG: ABC transporter ATP-binding protein [Anaerolineales bacterium]|uniref:ABC transporter ATP-binding protein n=1 Tax=Candidatus Desulfolinea nitratireducens TaxID=2841698 RepID=A0A8J6TK25_9CHLR|nr:ABC transporter ATP-binding protein [Candidatus Desulfolinea nitratireducens]